MADARNVLGEPLAPCCIKPMAGFFRNGRCDTDSRDVGRHVVCAEMTDAFLAFTKARGNDLSTAKPEFGFPGLKSGDRWCLCAVRWQEAAEAGVAPPVVLGSTHGTALDLIDLALLKRHALDLV